jgi:hypothetical protein
MGASFAKERADAVARAAKEAVARSCLRLTVMIVPYELQSFWGWLALPDAVHGLQIPRMPWTPVAASF